MGTVDNFVVKNTYHKLIFKLSYFYDYCTGANNMMSIIIYHTKILYTMQFVLIVPIALVYYTDYCDANLLHLDTRNNMPLCPMVFYFTI